MFNRKQKEFIRFQKDLKNDKSIQNDNIAHIYEDKRGNLWIGIGSGIELLDRKTFTFTHYNYIFSNTLLGSYPGDILEDKEGNLWIGTFEGLCILDRDKNKVEEFFHNDKDKSSISSNVVYTLFEDSRGNLWIGTVGGLNLYDRKTRSFRAFHAKDGLPSDAIYGILEDKKGNLWISTSNGISQFNPKTKSFKNYNVDDGLQGNEFKLNAFYKLRNGAMLFGGDNGFNLFYPDKIKDNKVVPPVLFTDFKIFNKSVPIGSDSPLKKHISQTEELTLSYKNSVISFEFAALSYFSPERNQYAYKLEGFEDEWNFVGNKREATYTSLEAGEYTFRVKASNNDGIWNEKGKSIKIIITPPFWQTWWFRVVMFFVFLILLNVFIRLRVNSYRRQKEILKRLVQKKTKEIIAKSEGLERANIELSKQKEEILDQKNEILAMSQKVKEADEKKLKFFTNISHEIRTPLTLILGPAERLIEKAESAPNLKEELGIVYKNANRLLNLINELMDFNKMDNGEMKMLVGEGDIVAFCSEIVYAFEELSERKKIRLSFLPNIDRFITWFDASKMEVVLFNLISNAFKFTPEHGEIKVDLTIGKPENQIAIFVTDNGIGIEKEKINKIFDRYYQIESSVSLHKGTGLGLAYTRELVELMGGKIEAKSCPGHQTIFNISLPLLTPEIIEGNDKYIQLPEEKIMVRNKTVNGFSEHIEEINYNHELIAEGLKILVVDDNEDLRKYIRSCLGEGFMIYEAKNGTEGLISAKQHFPNLIISDLMMPEMDGMEFCLRIKEDFEISHIPVILLTAKTDEESKIEGYEKGADDYITKPFSKDLLMARIDNLIRSRNKLRESFKEKVILEPKKVTVSSPDEKFLVKAMEIVESNIHNSEFDATEFVKGMGMSRSLVYMKLKELINLSPAEFIKITRLKRACQLLKEKKYRISDVCYMIGFTDPHYFTISFKKLYGKTPTEFIEVVNNSQ
ncbi:MAG TPA: response regulator [Cytophagales bacterium]|nr:response regulator [Cytophagales bacterium]